MVPKRAEDAQKRRFQLLNRRLETNVKVFFNRLSRPTASLMPYQCYALSMESGREPDARSKLSRGACSDALLRHRERKTPSGRRQRSEVML
jgi:hypothetical protein